MPLAVCLEGDIQRASFAARTQESAPGVARSNPADRRRRAFCGDCDIAEDFGRLVVDVDLRTAAAASGEHRRESDPRSESHAWRSGLFEERRVLDALQVLARRLLNVELPSGQSDL